VPKVPICAEIRPDKAYCINTITSQEFVWDDQNLFEDKTYWDARPTLLLLPASSWVEIKKFIIEVCKKTKKCDSQVSSWERTVDVIDQQIDLKTKP
jgi:hypothetical protein